MEGVRPVDQAEALQPPNFVEIFADEQATIFGFTGTIRELGSMCPVDLNDPSISLQDKNDFFVKVANESGMEIGAEYGTIFSETLERLGLEPKFILKPSEEVTKPEKPVAKAEVIEQEITAKSVQTDQESVKTEKYVKDDARDIKNNILAGHAEQQITELREKLAKVHAAATVETEKFETEVVQTKLKARTQSSVLIEKSEQIHQQVEFAELPEIVLDPELYKVSNNLAPSTDNIQELIHIEATATAGSELLHPLRAEITPVKDIEVVNIAEAETVTLPEVIASWEDLLISEPNQLYEDFTETLTLFAELFTVEQEFEASELPSVESGENTQSAPLAAQVITKLSELEPETRPEVALMLQDIVGAIHGIHVLENRSADPEEIEAVTEQLTQMCVQLFETIGITDYTDEQLKIFISIIIDPDFKPVSKQQISNVMDFTQRGMREGQHFIDNLPANFANLDKRLHQLLGTFVVSHAHRPVALAA